MAKDNSSKDMPRRKFLKNFGSGVIGTSVLLKNLPASQQKNQDEKLLKNGKKTIQLSFSVNGKKRNLYIEPQTTLAQILREDLSLTGTKVVCNQGECGSCTVLLNNETVYACHMLAIDAAGKEVITIEGLLDGEKLHPIQEAFIERDGLQCGFCTPGQIMATYGLLKKNPNPSHDQVIKGMAGNLCRCSAYPKIIESVKLAAKMTGK